MGARADGPSRRGAAAVALALAFAPSGCDGGSDRDAPGEDAGADGPPSAPACVLDDAPGGDAGLSAEVVTDAGVKSIACGDVAARIVRETCVGGICHHSGNAPAAGLDLLSPCVADRLVGVASTCTGRALVDPAAPERSFVLEKLTIPVPECGGETMPYDNHLPPEQLACMKAWIEGLAAAARR